MPRLVIIFTLLSNLLTIVLVFVLMKQVLNGSQLGMEEYEVLKDLIIPLGKAPHFSSQRGAWQHKISILMAKHRDFMKHLDVSLMIECNIFFPLEKLPFQHWSARKWWMQNWYSNWQYSEVVFELNDSLSNVVRLRGCLLVLLLIETICQVRGLKDKYSSTQLHENLTKITLTH